ncbi:MAG TPA: glycosyltransferase family 61 protein [Pyrinomonadaceae bacterium]
MRISPDTGKATGYLWHYGHFIHDLIMPLADWIIEQDIDPAAIDLFIEDTPDQSVGSYVDLITSLLGVRTKLFAPHAFKDLHGKDLVLDGYLFGPYKASSLVHVQQMVLSRFDLRPVGANPPEVILIERGHRPSGFEDCAELSESSRKSGKQRRMIVNHKELSAALEARYGHRFCNVVLEDIPVAEQVMLFHHARLVIGQHGGGLNNLIWMKGNNGAVVELAPTAIKTFQNLCLAKGLKYRTLGPMSRRNPRIDPAQMLRLLDTLGC